ncbi:MAG TPA: hydroxysqualene dehydroxylase HpnE [Usitatibacteraceae bacterium]
MDRLENLGAELSVAAPRIAIIGGGYAGMAAAVRLAELGRQSILFEGGKVLGGRARRIDYRGVALDNGQHILSGAYAELLRMMALVGVPSAAWRRIPLRLDMPPEFSLRAPRLPAPLHLAWALLTATGLGLGERWAAIRLMRRLAHDRFVVDPAWSVTRLLDHYRQPARLVRCLWQPLTISALNTPPDSASAQVFACVLRDALAASREASDLILPCADLSALFPEPAAVWLTARGNEVRLGNRVVRIDRVDRAGTQQWAVHTAEPASSEQKLFERVIVAVAPHQLDSLALPVTLLPQAFDYEPIYTVYLQYAQSVPLPQAMLGQLSGHCQWFFDREHLSGKSGLVAGVISASGPHESLDQHELAQRVHAELESHVGALPPPLWYKVIAEKFATFACTPALKRPAAETTLPGLYLAGDFVACDYPATLEAAVRNGAHAAELAHASLPIS